MDTRIYDPITQGQNNGTPCPYCHSPQGHRATCTTLNATVAYLRAKLAPIAEPTFTEADVIALHGLGVRL